MKLLLCIFAIVATAMADPQSEEILKAGNDQFTANMFQEVVKSQGNKSCVLSAFSVMTPLAQLAVASVGASHDELLRAIGFPNDNVTKAVFTDVNTRLRSVKGVELKQANKIYINDGYSLNDQFASFSKETFNTEVQNINFQESVKAAAEINAWVEDHTNKRIKDLLNPDSIDPSTVSILVNAIYFKGKWAKPFDKELTRDRDFHVSKDQTIKVPMMYQSDDFKYGESKELDAKLLEMEYEGGETSLIVVLPNKVDGISSLIEAIKTPATLNKALESMYYNDVEVSLPKFKIETTTNLVEVLEKMNIHKLFSATDARLDNLLKEAKDLYVSSATQKAFIEVNEEGAEAAAANQVAIVEILSLRITPKFDADHPFVFFLKQNNTILFNGVYRP